MSTEIYDNSAVLPRSRSEIEAGINEIISNSNIEVIDHGGPSAATYSPEEANAGNPNMVRTSAGTYVYKPDADFRGDDIVTYRDEFGNIDSTRREVALAMGYLTDTPQDPSNTVAAPQEPQVSQETPEDMIVPEEIKVIPAQAEIVHGNIEAMGQLAQEYWTDEETGELQLSEFAFNSLKNMKIDDPVQWANDTFKTVERTIVRHGGADALDVLNMACDYSTEAEYDVELLQYGALTGKLTPKVIRGVVDKWRR